MRGWPHGLSLRADDAAPAELMAARAEATSALAGEQAALQRVALLVARGAGEAEVCTAVNEEVAALVRVGGTSLLRFEADDTATVLAVHGTGHGAPPTGSRHVLDADLRALRSSGRPRSVGDRARGAIAVPITVEGGVWGLSIASPAPAERFPEGTEARIAGFTTLAATALANAQARSRLQELADEQAALRRVAERVAREAPQDEVLACVVREACVLFAGRYAVLTRYGADGSSTVVAAHAAPEGARVGTRTPPGELCMAQEVRATGRPVQVDDYEGRSAREWERACALGVSAGAGAPVVVSGSAWGALVVMTRREATPAGLAARLVDFAELVATAIAGAQARADQRAMAEEQGALRRVAELVARGVGEGELLERVAVEASRLIDDEATSLVRVDGDGEVTVVATCGSPAPVGMRVVLDPGDDGLITRILRTRAAQRLDDSATVDGPAFARDRFGVRSSVGAPIVVEDRVWGILGASSAHEALPAGAERRLEQFAELIAAAVANAQARARVQQLADEQAALRRVAELVARDVPPEAVFDAVAEEASRLLGDVGMALSRYDATSDATIVASCRTAAPVGLRVPGGGATCHAEVFRTGRAARVSTLKGTPLEGIAGGLGVHSVVGVPIAVAGRVWGVLTTATPGRECPPDTEARLAQFAGLVGTAIANAENREQLAASRARVVAAADESRRRLQRDVHDGAQQRLVQTVITLKLARQALERGDGVDGLLDEALQHAGRASSELRDLVRGILPAAVARGDLRSAVDALLADLPVRADVAIDAPRLPPATATTAYFVVAEALANVVKHARAARVAIRAGMDGDVLVVEVADDGAGGADAEHGSGLTGLSDRVAAADGLLELSSPPGSGTTVTARLPLPRAGP